MNDSWLTPWRWNRRPAGIVMLVLTCAFVGGWFRSQFKHDDITIVTKSWTFKLSSARSYFGLNATRLGANAFTLKVDWAAYPIKESWINSRNWGAIVRNRYDASGFHFGAMGTQLSMLGYVAYVYVSYAIAVGVLAVLCAWLLLSKPRTGKKLQPSTRPN